MKKALREWRTYEYYDPEIILPRLNNIRKQISMTATPDKVANLRTNMLSSEREAWDAAIFCYLISKAINKKLFFSKVESSDYDSIFMLQEENSDSYFPVQMKELVPNEINPKATLQSIINNLEIYTNSPDLIVGIKLNRNENFNFSNISTEKAKVAEIWCFGSTEKNESKWGLYGNLLSNYRHYNYELSHT